MHRANRKGITAVISTTLLIAITTAAAGSAYFYAQDTFDTVERSEQVNVASQIQELGVETCWRDGLETHIRAKNTNSRAIDASRLDVYVGEGRPINRSEVSVDKEIVKQGETFEILIDPAVHTRRLLSVGYGSEKFAADCTTIEKPSFAAGSLGGGNITLTSEGSGTVDGDITFYGREMIYESTNSGRAVQPKPNSEYDTDSWSVSGDWTWEDGSIEREKSDTMFVAPQDGDYRVTFDYEAEASASDMFWGDSELEVTADGHGRLVYAEAWTSRGDDTVTDGGSYDQVLSLDAGDAINVYLRAKETGDAYINGGEAAITRQVDPDPVTAEFSVDTDRPTDVRLEFAGRKSASQDYDTGSWSASGNWESDKPSEVEKNQGMFYAPTDGTYTVRFDYRASANTAKAWGDCCLYGDSEVEVTADGHGTILSASADVSGEEYYTQDVDSGTFEQDLYLNAGDTINVYLRANEIASASVSGGDSAITRKAGSGASTGRVNLVFDGDTYSTNYLSSGEKDSIILENLSTGTYSFTVDLTDGDTVDYAAKWDEVQTVVDPGIDYDGDGVADIEYEGILGENENVTKSFTLPEGTYNFEPVKATGSLDFGWEYDQK